MSVVVPGGPVPEQAPAGEPLLTSAAESAPVQQTSFSISLDINTNTVSIQGSVTSPNQADRTAKCATALSLNPDCAASSATQPTIVEQQDALEEGDTQEEDPPEDCGPNQIANIEEGWEPQVEEDPEEVVESGEEAHTAEESKQKCVSDEAFESLGENQGTATDCVAKNAMKTAHTIQPAPDLETSFEEKDAAHTTQAAWSKSTDITEGSFTMSASDKQLAIRSNALDSVQTASEGADALKEGRGQDCEGNDAIYKAICDAIAEMQEAVAEHDS